MTVLYVLLSILWITSCRARPKRDILMCYSNCGNSRYVGFSLKYIALLRSSSNISLGSITSSFVISEIQWRSLNLKHWWLIKIMLVVLISLQNFLIQWDYLAKGIVIVCVFYYQKEPACDLNSNKDLKCFYF